MGTSWGGALVLLDVEPSGDSTTKLQSIEELYFGNVSSELPVVGGVGSEGVCFRGWCIAHPEVEPSSDNYECTQNIETSTVQPQI